MKTQLKKIVEVMYSPNNFNDDYFARLNNWLKNYQREQWLAPENKNVTFVGAKEIYSRPLTVLDYDERKKFQKCFAYSSPKSTDCLNDLSFFFLPNGTKIRLNTPILVPSKYLRVFNAKDELKRVLHARVREWLIETEKDHELVKKFAFEIEEQYKTIKYCREDDKHDFNDIKRAHYKMINEDKVEYFCKMELRLIEEST